MMEGFPKHTERLCLDGKDVMAQIQSAILGYEPLSVFLVNTADLDPVSDDLNTYHGYMA